ncbi:hypothetical protein J6590_056962 [Homalodisca vitripennis]|nr:hypothetical protein J6590_056962 [Homalodisca vitripennis]
MQYEKVNETARSDPVAGVKAEIVATGEVMWWRVRLCVRDCACLTYITTPIPRLQGPVQPRSAETGEVMWWRVRLCVRECACLTYITTPIPRLQGPVQPRSAETGEVMWWRVSRGPVGLSPRSGSVSGSVLA